MTQAAASPIDSPDGPCTVAEPLRAEAAPAAFLEALDRLKQLGRSRLLLLGGEPTQHPDFAWMITRALERGFSVLVRSCGLIPHAVVKKLERLPAEKVTLLLPIVVPGEVWPHQLDHQAYLFRRLGPRILPGINLLFPSVKLDFALDWIDSFRLSRRVCLELRPLAEDDPHGTARLIGEFARRAAGRGVQLELNDVGEQALDLLPDGRVVLSDCSCR